MLRQTCRIVRNQLTRRAIILSGQVVRNMAAYPYNWDEEKFIPSTAQESKITHMSNSEELISKIPPIGIDGDVAVCTGIRASKHGHPAQYIGIKTPIAGEAVPCKYCGLRYFQNTH